MNRRKTPAWIGYLLTAAIVLVASTGLSQSGATQLTLYERLGGLMAITVVVDDFIDAMVPDPFLNRNPAIAEAREMVPSPYLKYQVTSMVCQATGGPCEYTGRGMKESHAHLNITETEWDRMLVIFKEVLDKHLVPAAEQQELLEIVGSTKDEIVTAGGTD